MLTSLPFSALRAFETVVRMRGFGRAAEELGVSQSAVSQHVRALEEWTGHKLLIRGSKHSTATEDGQRLADAIALGMGQISDVCSELRQKARQDQTITVSCLPGFAFAWLFPRLISFDLKRPELPVSISTAVAPVNFTTGNEDVAIRYGLGDYPGLHVEKLMSEHLVPVCAPGLPTEAKPLRRIADLRHHTLLVDELKDIGGTPPSWSFWARETGNALPSSLRTRRFGQSNLVVQAAIQGLGVALGREPLVIDALTEGKLVRPLKGEALSHYAYWFVCPHGTLKSPRIQAFRDWLFEEAAAQHWPTDAAETT